jgi:hypothetical protein
MALGFVVWGPTDFHGAYQQDVRQALVPGLPSPLVTEDDLEPLPPLVQRYLRRAGVVGQPRVADFRVRIHGRIRANDGARWMPLDAEQHDFIARRKRFFYLTSSMFGVPVRGYHRYADSSASMNIRAAGLVSVVHATGRQLFQSETVTLLNDMCLFAPATLLDPALVWEEFDVRSARVAFTNAGVTVRAELTFNTAGELIDFVSDDRYQLSSDGRQATLCRWSTPVTRYREFGPVHLIAAGEGRWHPSDGSFAYIELEVDEVEYNVSAGVVTDHARNRTRQCLPA